MRTSMSDPSLHLLEREVEAARAKLWDDLSTLRSPTTYSEFTSDLKSEALDMKDALVDKAKSGAQSTFASFVDDLKARAAANPAAALAIGAGIAWRLIQRPPIATALIGAGLYSLFRTTPSQPAPRDNESFLAQARERLVEQASDFAGSVKERAAAMGDVATEKASELAAGVKDRALSLGEAVTEKATELAGAATDHTQQWSEEVRSSVRRAAGDAPMIMGSERPTLEELRQSAMKAAERAKSRSTAVSDDWLHDSLTNQQARDKFLLGAAGVAVVAALGIASHRRSSEPAEAD
jgi:hypothetical protein